MQLNFQTENKENSQILLKVTIDKDEVKKNYDELIADAQKNAIIDGFRKGKVPVSILEMKYKEGFLAETAGKIIDDSFKELYDKLEKKPLNYNTPTLNEYKNPILGDDFTFELIYDVYPDIKIGEYKNIEFIKDEVKITDDDVNKEIDRLKQEFATIETKEGAVEAGDIAVVEYSVTSEGKEVYKRDSEYVHTEKGYDIYKIGKDIIGLQKDGEKEFSKTMDDDAPADQKGKTFDFKVKVKDIKKQVVPELTDDLASQINEKCKTVDELKDTVRKNITDYAEDTIKQKALKIILKEIIASFEGEIPQSMLIKQQEAFYQELVERFRGNEKAVLNSLKHDNLTKETYMEKMKDKSIEEIKKALILSEIVKLEQIKASDDDIKKHMEPFSKYYKMEVNELFENLKKAGNLHNFENQVEINKALDFIYENGKSKKGKKINFEDLLKAGETEEKTEE
jgi:trigger factor